MSTLNSRLRGLAATLALVAFVVGVPAVLLAIDAVPDPTAFSWSRLTAPDDGTLVVEVLAAVCWIAWAVFTCQLVASIVSQVRGMRTPRLPGLAMPQLAADRLVAAAALLFVAVPSATAFLPQPKAEAAVTATPLPDATRRRGRARCLAPFRHRRSRRRRSRRSSATPSSAATASGGSPRSAWETARGTSSSSSSTRPSSTGVPTSCFPGTVLRVPGRRSRIRRTRTSCSRATPSPRSPRTNSATPTPIPSIFEASRDTVQPDGAHLTDPDLILPGWKLTIPGQRSRRSRSSRSTLRSHRPRDDSSRRRSHLPSPPK